MKPRKFMRATTIVVAALIAGLTAACGGTGSSGSGTITVYSADGLGSWYKGTFDKFTKDTGIGVNLVEAGSGEVVSRVEKEQSNPQADLLVTLPPFIQKADESGLLVPNGVDTAGIAKSQVGPEGRYIPIVNNALSFIANPGAQPAPANWDDLLDPRFKGKLQYSTPGQAGDGTAVLVLLQHLRGKDGALEYLTKLQANNVGPSSSTGKLQPKVSNGELLVANGDVQMNLGWTVQIYNVAEALPNLINPFFMLPLLSIVGLKVRDIVGFTFLQFLLHTPFVLFLLWLFAQTLTYVPPMMPG